MSSLFTAKKFLIFLLIFLGLYLLGIYAPSNFSYLHSSIGNILMGVMLLLAVVILPLIFFPYKFWQRISNDVAFQNHPKLKIVLFVLPVLVAFPPAYNDFMHDPFGIVGGPVVFIISYLISAAVFKWIFDFLLR